MASNFSHDVADKLLERLSSDDGFRALFQSDPRAALLQVGHETPAADVGNRGADPVMCLGSAPKLAGKDALKSARSKLQTQLTTSAFHYDVML